jgi:hypothetical protein
VVAIGETDYYPASMGVFRKAIAFSTAANTRTQRLMLCELLGHFSQDGLTTRRNARRKPLVDYIYKSWCVKVYVLWDHTANVCHRRATG